MDTLERIPLTVERLRDMVDCSIEGFNGSGDLSNSQIAYVLHSLGAEYEIRSTVETV